MPEALSLRSIHPMKRIYRLALPLLAAAAAACTDSAGPAAPDAAPPPAENLGALQCTVHVAAGDMRCASPSALGGARGDLIVGGQGVYVQIRSQNPSYDSVAQVFSLDVTLQNLLGQPVGTEDGTTPGGIRIFFAAPPAVTGGDGGVEVRNPDGVELFTSAGQEYFFYPEILAPYERTAARTWQWNVPTTVETFSFQVYVTAAVPNQSGVLRWTREQGDVVSRDLFAVWGTGPQDIWAGGSNAMMYNNGTRWVVVPGEWRDIQDIHGSGSDDVWAVGGAIHHFDGRRWTQIPAINENWNSVYAAAPNDVYVTGHAFGHTMHWNGTSWDTVFTRASGRIFTGVWGFGSDDVHVIGGKWNRAIDTYDGWVWHWDGAAWDSTALPGPAGDIWGSAPDDVYVIGGSKIYHYDGSTWTRVDGGITNQSLRSVWGTGPDDVWAVGGGYHGAGNPESTVLHWDGTTWTEEQTGGLAVAAAVYTPNPDKVYAVGYRGMIHRRSGGTWSSESSGRHALIAAVAPISNAEAITAGCGGLKRNSGPGGAWETIYGTDDCLQDVWITPGAAEIFAVGYVPTGSGGAVIVRWDGAAWTRTPLPDVTYLNAVWGLDSAHVYAVGEGDGMSQVPRLFQWDGTAWTDVPLAAEFGSGQLYGVWGSSPDNLYVVGTMVLHWNGEGWTREFVHEWSDGWQDVWGTGPDDVYLVGGRLAHWNGSAWSSTVPGAQAVWGSGPNDVYVTGGNTRHFNGTAWTPVNIETASNLWDIGGTSARSVWAVGEGGAVMRGRR